MAEYLCIVMHGETGGEGRYRFHGPDALLTETPVRVFRKFMEMIDQNVFPSQHVDYEINAAMKNNERKVITVLGQMIFDGDPPAPFMAMISHVPQD